MSHSPAVESELSQATDPESEFRQRLRDVNRLMSSNGTLSGHERNCLFLNTGGKHFATVSAITGFDFDDDTRAVATVDWDGDGDLDVWTTNRTAPRVRMLRNASSNENHFVAVKLQGTTCNRDAIGATVEVVVDAEASNDEKLVKTLRAGEGFLTQCSKWLHFGLGEQDQVREIVVTWPDGKKESFAGLGSDARFRCVQGTGKLQPLPQRSAITFNVEPTQEDLAQSGQARIPLTERIPLPVLRYENADGVVTVECKTPTLLVLWSSECGACLEELQSLVSHQKQIAAQDLRVVALCIDGLLASPPPLDNAKKFLESIEFCFDSGNATTETVKRLQTVYDMPFAVPVEMATPTSFMLDSRRQLGVIYRGKTPPADLLNDAKQLSSTGSDWARYAEPHRGRWNVEPTESPRLLRIPLELVDGGHLDDAIDYVSQNQSALIEEDEFAKLAVWIGDQLIAKHRVSDALSHYQLALTADPNDLTVMNNVAWQYATHPDANVRDGKVAVKWAERAATQTKFSNAGVLDTLAASYAADQQFSKAVKAIERAILIARQQQPQAVEKYTTRLQLYKSGKMLLQD